MTSVLNEHLDLPPKFLSTLTSELGVKELRSKTMIPDGSERAYVRVSNPQSDSSFVVMMVGNDDRKRLQSQQYDWLLLHEILKANGIFVPHVYLVLPEWGAIVMEDLGDCSLATYLTPGEVDSACFDTIFDIIEQFRAIPRDPAQPCAQRSFDFAKLYQEMLFFDEHYLQDCQTWTDRSQRLFLSEAKDLCRYLESLSRGFVHRDFHSRNLMIKDGKVWTIDFQDARMGPFAYDLVSICFDSYLTLSNEQRCRLVDLALSRWSRRLTRETLAEIETSWPAMLLQRQIKALGSFGFLSKKKARSYLSHAPAALKTLEMDDIEWLRRWPFLTSEFIHICNSHRALTYESAS